MRCTACASDNADGLKFCGGCGAPLPKSCPRCRVVSPPQFKFCGECGQHLGDAGEAAAPGSFSPAGRKFATVVFSDLCGYTSMSEKLDPEEVKEIMGRIFGEIAQIVARYEGFIDKFIGDAVMALFGVPLSHEDDAVRAVRAAREIHEAVAALSHVMERRTGLPLRMHTGINTGLVVTGVLDGDQGRSSVTGDTINIASRLTGLATAGEIVVGPITHSLTEQFFTFEVLPPAALKGKALPITAYRLGAPVKQPQKIHRTSGRRARLVGRVFEIERLQEAAENLLKGRGASIGIVGEAGTGKSRLLEEFRRSLDAGSFQWYEAGSYAYTRNVPYFPFTALFGRYFGVEEGDQPEAVSRRIETGLRMLSGPAGAGRVASVLPFVGSLFPSAYPQPEEFRTALWQERFRQAILDCVSAWSSGTALVLCFEDVHWADPSSLALLRFLSAEIRLPVLLLYSARPPFALLPVPRIGDEPAQQVLFLNDLPSEVSQEMVESLLGTAEVPPDLRTFIQNRAEGNPMYLEEVVNTLLETGALIREGGAWRSTRDIREAELSPTIHGIVSARIDRLDARPKRLLQDASAIGRTFPLGLLGKVTGLDGALRPLLDDLERLDLLKVIAESPEPEFAFKHALIQEVVYGSLLRSERQFLHERTGLALEELYQPRIEELCETLAFHFARGQSRLKAADYLQQSGQKAARRYALEEAHQYYRTAHEILSALGGPSREEQSLLAALLLEWFEVYIKRADFRGLWRLLESSRRFMEALGDNGVLGHYYHREGVCQAILGDLRASEVCLQRALALSEMAGDAHLTGRICDALSYTYWELGRLQDAIGAGERAVELARALPEDRYLFIRAHAELAKPCNTAGMRERILELAAALRTYGEEQSVPVALATSHWCSGVAQLLACEPVAACESFNLGLQSALEPFDREGLRAWLSFALLYSGQFEKAEEVARSMRRIAQELDFRAILLVADANLALVLASRGELEQARELLEQGLATSTAQGRVIGILQFEYYLGKVHALRTYAPGAIGAAEVHLRRAVEEGRKIGARGFIGGPLFDLGMLCRGTGRHDEARACLEEALALFEQCGDVAAAGEARKTLAGPGEERPH